MSPARCHLLTVGMVVPSRAAVSAAVRYPAAPQPDAVAGDAAVAAHGGEAAGGVGASPAAGDAALAEDDRDLVELVLIQQADRVDGGLGGGVGFPGGQRVRDGQGAVLAAGQPDVRGDRVTVFEQGDVGDEQPDEPLAVFGLAAVTLVS